MNARSWARVVVGCGLVLAVALAHAACGDTSAAEGQGRDAAVEAEGVTVRVVPCPKVTLSASPPAAALDASISVMALATVPDGAPVSVVWSAPAGTFDDASAADTTFTCGAPGSITLTLVASYDVCQETREVTVRCVDAP